MNFQPQPRSIKFQKLQDVLLQVNIPHLVLSVKLVPYPVGHSFCRAPSAKEVTFQSTVSCLFLRLGAGLNF